MGFIIRFSLRVTRDHGQLEQKIADDFHTAVYTHELSIRNRV